MLPYSIKIDPNPIPFAQLAIGETFCSDRCKADIDWTREMSVRSFYIYSIATKLNEAEAIYNHGVTDNIQEWIATSRRLFARDLKFHRVKVSAIAQPKPTDAVLGGSDAKPGPYDAVLGSNGGREK